MIYITADTYIPIDIIKLNNTRFPEQQSLTKRDYVIICGDFGGVWDNSEEELYWRKWLKNKNFTTLFIDGNHENFNLLKKHKIENWNGGKVHFINDSIIHLMRGQIYTIDGLTFFTMGGATSIDKHSRKEGKSWWPDEMPNNKEFDEGMNNLDKYNWEVDYVLTHTAPSKVFDVLKFTRDNDPLAGFFNMLDENLTFKRWFCGHMHEDIDVDKYTLLYDRVVKLI